MFCESMTYANSDSHSCLMTVMSRIKYFEVSTTSWKMTHSGARLKSTESGWTERI
jgi:hypothetical protein